jgi:hypothetical protein
MRFVLRLVGVLVLALLLGCRARRPSTPTSAPAPEAAASAPAAPAAAPAPGAGDATASPSAPGAPSPSPEPTAPPAAARDASLQWKNDLSTLAADYECGLKEVVSTPPELDPRMAVWRAYDAARHAVVEGNDGPWADIFVTLFTRMHRREWILEQYWPRLKVHVSKYTVSSRDSTYVLCRIEERDGRWKGFVKSFSRDKSNPPITVEMEDGVPRIAFFSY